MGKERVSEVRVYDETRLKRKGTGLEERARFTW